MTNIPLPRVPARAPDPATDPDAFLRAVLAQWFRPGLIDSIIRTWVPVGLGLAIAWSALHFRWLGLPADPSTTFVSTVTGGVIAGYYLLARLVERRFPTIGRWLVALNLTKGAPAYAPADTAAAVEQAAASASQAQAIRRGMQ